MAVEEYVGTVYELERIEFGEDFCDFMGYRLPKRLKFNCHQEVLKSLMSCCCKMYRYVVKSEGCLSYFEFRTNINYYGFTWSNGSGYNRVEFHDNVIYAVQNGRKKIESWREYSPTQMVMTVTCEGHTAKKYFRPVGHDDACYDWNGCCSRISKNKMNLV